MWNKRGDKRKVIFKEICVSKCKFCIRTMLQDRVKYSYVFPSLYNHCECTATRNTQPERQADRYWCVVLVSQMPWVALPLGDAIFQNRIKVLIKFQIKQNIFVLCTKYHNCCFLCHVENRAFFILHDSAMQCMVV